MEMSPFPTTRLEGIFVPPIVPFQAGEAIDWPGFESNLERFEQAGIAGYVVAGSSGERMLLSDEEALDLLTMTVRRTSAPVLAGVHQQSPVQALQFMQAAADRGASGYLVTTPGYYGAQYDQRRFFEHLAERAPRPLVVYHIPVYTGVRLKAELLNELAQHPNIAGVKDSAADLGLLQQLPSDFAYLTGSGSLLLASLQTGARGGVLALANVLPGACVQLFDLFREGRLDEARRLQQRLIPVNRVIGASEGYGLAGLKFAASLGGFTGGEPRMPLRALDESARSRLREVVSRALQEGSADPPEAARRSS